MPIVTFTETGISAGSNTGLLTWSADHNFPEPGLTVWSRAYLDGVNDFDGGGEAIVAVFFFKDDKGIHPGPLPPGWFGLQPGIFAHHCTWIRFVMYTDNCVGSAVFTTEIFG